MFSVINRISIKLNSFCNSNCKYCHQSNIDKNTFTNFSNFSNLISFLKKLNLDSEVEVTLTGGEVTLYPERYIEAVKWFTRLEREIDIKFRYAVVSNGTNIDIIRIDK